MGRGRAPAARSTSARRQLDGALREAAEEVGVPTSPAELVGQYVFRPSVEWSYTTVVVRVDEPFGAPMNFETEAVEWVLPAEVERRALHPGFAGAWPHVRQIVERV